MHCLFYIACFLAVLQLALAVPTLAPRADTTATKGQSDQKCWGLGLGYCGGYGGFGSYGFDPFGLYTLSLSSLYGYSGLAFGAGSLYGYGYGYHGYGGGLLMKDAPGAGKTPSVSASLISMEALERQSGQNS
ncbi:hypothetical protein PTTG_26213 [Puccinia triticina 1-1 BBBD Race 1]|uniref:Uncharacterized protein n=1 Tax=Puccinia triticina (isolate 1-1 / race 1 (BBBD)) TaxID=630390 RepID=A0A180GWV1_PUCT1|nr:hypothetical protein PTTG_26213 [Puccinia triticina 1-1 BBBD Race 1]